MVPVCLSFETAAGGIEPPPLRLIAAHSFTHSLTHPCSVRSEGCYPDSRQYIPRAIIDNMFKVVKDAGNPFQKEIRNLLTLDISNPCGAEQTCPNCERGRIRFQEFLKGLQSGQESTFYGSIKKHRKDNKRHPVIQGFVFVCLYSSIMLELKTISMT